MEATLTVLEWEGDLPSVGHYVKARAGRTAYLILEVRVAISPAKYVCKLICQREPSGSLPARAIVHPWKWAKR